MSMSWYQCMVRTVCWCMPPLLTLHNSDSVHCFVTETGCLLYTYKTDTPRGRPVIAWNVETPMFAHVAGTQIRLCNVSWDKLRHKQRSSGLDIHIPRTASPKVFPAYVGEGNVARVVESEDVTKSNGGMFFT